MPTRTEASATGRRVGESMDQDAPEADVINAMTQYSAGFSNDVATKFAKASEAVYCPTQLGGAPTPPPAWSPPIDFRKVDDDP